MGDFEDFQALPPFKNHDFYPSTGLGNFDATFDPKSGSLTVEVRVKLDFKDTYANKWDPADKASFTKGLAMVSKTWDGKFEIRCKKKGWEKLVVKPSFDLVATGDPHYEVTVAPTKGTGNTAVRPNGTAIFGMQATDRMANAKSQLDQIKRDLLSPFAIPVGKAGQTQLSFESMDILDLFAWSSRQAFGDDAPKVGLTLTGFGCKDKSGAKDDKANKANAERVQKVLEGFKLKAKWTLASADKVTKKDKDKKDVNAYPDIEEGVELRFNEADFNSKFPNDPASALDFSQATIAHEFGHMLGLPDEYNALCSETKDTLILFSRLGPDGKAEAEGAARLKDFGPSGAQAAKSDAIAKNQKAFATLCGKAAVPVPPFGKANPSIMSAGSKFMPCHVVTVWEFLVGKTKDHVSEKEWQIVAK